MKLSKLVMTAILMTGSMAFAQLDDAQIQETYAVQCGTLDDVSKVVGQDMAAATDEEKKELQEIRQTMYDVLVGGEKAIHKLLDEGSKNDTGGFGVILACGMIDQIASKVAEKGCLNIATGETTKGEAGIKACKSVMAEINGKAK